MLFCFLIKLLFSSVFQVSLVLKTESTSIAYQIFHTLQILLLKLGHSSILFTFYLEFCRRLLKDSYLMPFYGNTLNWCFSVSDNLLSWDFEWPVGFRDQTELHFKSHFAWETMLGLQLSGPVAHVIVGDSSGSVLDTAVGSLGAWFALSSCGTNMIRKAGPYWGRNKYNYCFTK